MILIFITASFELINGLIFDLIPNVRRKILKNRMAYWLVLLSLAAPNQSIVNAEARWLKFE